MTIATFYSSDPVAEVGADWYERLKSAALAAGQKRARLCLHHTPRDLLHEMIIVFHRDTVVRPHRHQSKTESFHVIFGELDVIMFDEEGRPARLISMGPLDSGKTNIYRLSSSAWHSVVVRSEYASIHEVTNGPFLDGENDFAPWAPTDPVKLREFLAAAQAVLEPRFVVTAGSSPVARVDAR